MQRLWPLLAIVTSALATTNDTYQGPPGGYNTCKASTVTITSTKIEDGYKTCKPKTDTVTTTCTTTKTEHDTKYTTIYNSTVIHDTTTLTNNYTATVTCTETTTTVGCSRNCFNLSSCVPDMHHYRTRYHSKCIMSNAIAITDLSRPST